MSDETWSNADHIAAKLTAEGLTAGAKAHGVTKHFGALLKTTIQRNASLPRSGPPGPRLQTGDYVRSWSLQTVLHVGDSTATVGTDRPQARRLEYGFQGRDSLGRQYNQPPYPHVQPAMDFIQPLFVAAIVAIPGDDF